ncbi:type I glyceraldehyde-3-phosphate dehydrogenase [Myxococcota bacterium]|nr:type I glyceraldehyde-3-phosphate dehydrogenase [Myxococcota bacterium]MBU1432519.1 type I glyceraldehyde-3-phosphate dehydrogenase [Myxococcota bacterium]MBU1898091.1 type I glyceraldehyde-3-phosphate dehydrogenase [Myxococcota bacterium]
MSRKIAINGFGRIGRMLFRIIESDPDLEIVAINDLTNPKTLAHLLKYDSVHGTFNGTVEVQEDAIIVNGRAVKIMAQRDPRQLPWAEMGVELVLECTGIFRNREKAGWHIDAGANKVIISAPGDDIDHTIVLGVNDETLNLEEHHIVSNGSCTTNCLAPVVKVIDQNFGVEHALMTTIHAYTNDQMILDLPHKDLRRARAAGMSMIPTSTGAAKAVGLVLPHLNGKLDGMAIRVPTPNVSLVDVTFTVKQETTKAAVNAALKAAAEGPLKGILAFEEAPLVSIDFNGCPASSTVDALSTSVMAGKSVKVLSWYDNEWGFSKRMAELSRMMLGLARVAG